LWEAKKYDRQNRYDYSDCIRECEKKSVKNNPSMIEYK
jgi:hypothetical protein